MNRPLPIPHGLAAGAAGVLLAALTAAENPARTIAPGPYQPSWESLREQYRCPDWFRDAKFGIWAHWGPQSEPEQGDGYARKLYLQGHPLYQAHLARYGHPSKVGFKDVCRLWKAENFDPANLLALYQRAGAKYFVALANHHCNFDNFNSKYQPWNAVNLGPNKDLIGLWANAARAAGLRFGVTVHAARAWTWYEPAQGADTTGPLAGVPYDGRLTKADGSGQWWNGYDPQDLYAQAHPVGAPPSAAYADKFFLRVKDLVDSYRPDLLYFDDNVLPLREVGEHLGLQLAAHFYNSNLAWHGRNEAVLATQQLESHQRPALVWNLERRKADELAPYPWQTATSIGGGYDARAHNDNHRYLSATAVIAMLIDVVSKNGNLLLNIPLRADGTLDPDEVRLLESVGQWLQIHGEAIYGTRPWKEFGEGTPAASTQGTEPDTQTYSASDIRFTTKGTALYAFCLGRPTADIRIASLGRDSLVTSRSVTAVRLLGSAEPLTWTQQSDALVIQRPQKLPGEHAIAFEIGLSQTPDVIYVPTPQVVVDKMLELAEVKTGDVVYDLGCGDGRIVVTAAKKYGVKAVGFDIDPQRIREAQANVRSNRVEHLVTIRNADIFTLDLREASVVTLYLLPDLNVRLMPQLEKLRHGARIVSHDFDMRGAKPVLVYDVKEPDTDPDDGSYESPHHTIYKWVVPWEKEDGSP
ncbi:MAG: methyltransferase domain-containing protein [Verrucomicrobia bacterium]|nr:methyltransferase domain-containing protein [Verrucomicrobiota bacterium]